MPNHRPGKDVASLKRGQRVSRKDSDAGGTVTKSRDGDPEGGVRVKWDDGSTSYYRGDQEANVRSSTRPVPALITCATCNLELRLFGIEPESEKRDLFTFECPKCGHLEVRGVLVSA